MWNSTNLDFFSQIPSIFILVNMVVNSMCPVQRCIGKSHTGRAGPPPPPPLSPSRPLIEAATHVVVALISVFAIKTSQDKGEAVGRRRRKYSCPSARRSSSSSSSWHSVQTWGVCALSLAGRGGGCGVGEREIIIRIHICSRHQFPQRYFFKKSLGTVTKNCAP